MQHSDNFVEVTGQLLAPSGHISSKKIHDRSIWFFVLLDITKYFWWFIQSPNLQCHVYCCSREIRKAL